MKLLSNASSFPIMYYMGHKQLHLDLGLTTEHCQLLLLCIYLLVNIHNSPHKTCSKMETSLPFIQKLNFLFKTQIYLSK